MKHCSYDCVYCTRQKHKENELHYGHTLSDWSQYIEVGPIVLQQNSPSKILLPKTGVLKRLYLFAPKSNTLCIKHIQLGLPNGMLLFNQSLEKTNRLAELEGYTPSWSSVSIPGGDINLQMSNMDVELTLHPDKCLLCDMFIDVAMRVKQFIA